MLNADLHLSVSNNFGMVSLLLNFTEPHKRTHIIFILLPLLLLLVVLLLVLLLALLLVLPGTFSATFSATFNFRK